MTAGDKQLVDLSLSPWPINDRESCFIRQVELVVQIFAKKRTRTGTTKRVRRASTSCKPFIRPQLVETSVRVPAEVNGSAKFPTPVGECLIYLGMEVESWHRRNHN